MIKFEKHLFKQALLNFFMEENVLKLKYHTNPNIAFRTVNDHRFSMLSSALVFSARRKYAQRHSKEQEKGGRKRKSGINPG